MKPAEATPTNEIESLLGQATPLPLEMHIAYDVTGYPVLSIHGLSGEQKRNSEMLDATMKLIVLAVNALPSLLKLREAVLTNSVNRPFAIDGALSEVDTALGLSPKPSQTSTARIKFISTQPHDE